MRTTALMVASFALLALPTGAAAASRCSGEIDRMHSLLTANDTASRPAAGSDGVITELPAPGSSPETVGSAGPPPAQNQIAASHDLAGAMTALERARMFDRHGDETACLSAVGEAKLMFGPR